MIRIDVHHLLASLTYLVGSHKHSVLMRWQLIENGGMGLLEIQRFAEMRECTRRLAAIADALDMPAGRASADRLSQNLDKVAPFCIALTPDRLSLLADEIAILTSSFQDEMEARLLFAFPASSAPFFPPTLFSVNRSKMLFRMSPTTSQKLASAERWGVGRPRSCT